MGCQQSKRAADVANGAHSPVMRPSTPSFQPRESLAARTSGGPGAGGASQGEGELEELPSFVLSTTSDLIKSSDSEAVQGMVGAFTFSFIQVSESSVSSGSGHEASTASSSDDGKQPELDGDAGDSAADQMPPIPEESVEHKDEHEEEDAHSDLAREQPDTKDLASGGTNNGLVIADVLVASPADAPSVRGQAARLSEVTNESDDVKEYLVTESGDVRVALDVAVEADSEADAVSTSEDPLVSVVTAVVDEVIDNAILNGVKAAAESEAKEDTDSHSHLVDEPASTGEALSKGYSTLTNPSSTELYDQSTSTYEVIEESNGSDGSTWAYAVVGSSVSADSIVMYHIQLTDGTQSKWPAPVHKRYSEFKQLRSALKASGISIAADFPPLPRAGLTQLVRGKLSKRTIAKREQQFTTMLRFIAQHRGLEESTVFQHFIGR